MSVPLSLSLYLYFLFVVSPSDWFVVSCRITSCRALFCHLYLPKQCPRHGQRVGPDKQGRLHPSAAVPSPRHSSERNNLRTRLGLCS
jgi:hypothetical protein